MRFSRVLFLCLLLTGFCRVAQAGEPCLLARHHRSVLEEKGISVSLASVEDFAANVKGGLQTKSTWLGLFDMGLTVETGKAGLWSDGKFYFHGANAHGHKKLSQELVGDLQGVDGLESPRVTRLIESWYEHSWQDLGLSVLGGVHDMNSEFAVSEIGCLFLNSGLGLTPSMDSNFTVSTYPNTALGTRMKWAPNERFSVMMAAYDGDPGDSTDHPHLPDFSWNGKGGTLSIAEAAWGYKLPVGENPPAGTLKAGFWHHSGNFDDVSSVDDNGDPLRHDDNYGGYGIVEQALWEETEDQGLSVFLLGGGAPDDRNTVDFHLGGGVNYTGLIPVRDKDQIGVAVSYASVSNKEREAEGLDHGETAIEGTYRFVVNDYVTAQPDFQYVINPGADLTIKNTTIAALRLEIIY